VKVPIAAWSSLQFHRDTTLQLHQIVDYHTIQTSFHLMLLYWDSHPLQLNSRWASVTVRWTNHRLITDCRNVKSKKDDTRKLATVGECGRTESSDERNYAIKIMCDSYFIGAEQHDDPDERPEGDLQSSFAGLLTPVRTGASPGGRCGAISTDGERSTESLSDVATSRGDRLPPPPTPRYDELRGGSILIPTLFLLYKNWRGVALPLLEHANNVPSPATNYIINSLRDHSPCSSPLIFAAQPPIALPPIC
jgi:hypothetical protein